jgi:hypothetical protein
MVTKYKDKKFSFTDKPVVPKLFDIISPFGFHKSLIPPPASYLNDCNIYIIMLEYLIIGAIPKLRVKCRIFKMKMLHGASYMAKNNVDKC